MRRATTSAARRAAHLIRRYAKLSLAHLDRLSSVALERDSKPADSRIADDSSCFASVPPMPNVNFSTGRDYGMVESSVSGATVNGIGRRGIAAF